LMQGLQLPPQSQWLCQLAHRHATLLLLVLCPLLALLLLLLVPTVVHLPHLLLWQPLLEFWLLQWLPQHCLIASSQRHLHCLAQSLAECLAAASVQQLALCCHIAECQQPLHQLLLLLLVPLQLHCTLLLLHWSLPALHDPLTAAARLAAACHSAAAAAAAALCHPACPQPASFCSTAAPHPLLRPLPAQPPATAAALLLPALLLLLPLPHPQHPSL
jgi:hypothetical protein